MTGPPCSGKTTCGRLAAAILGAPFIDLDELIATRAGMGVARFLSAFGEGAFRALEESLLGEAVSSPGPLVLALGGGSLLLPRNVSLVSASMTIVTLRTPDDILAGRLGCPGRPLAADAGALLALLERRRSHYASLPNQIDCPDGDPGACAREIAAIALRRGRA